MTVAPPENTESECSPAALRLELRFDAATLHADVARLLAEPWTAHVNTADYAGDWTDIALRGPAGAPHPILQLTSHPGHQAFEDTAALGRCPTLAAAVARFQCPLGSVRLLRLAAGAQIREHDDPDLVDGPVRVHVPIISNPGVRFVIGGERYDMSPGEAWAMDGSRRHRVANDGATDRIHMVLDCVMNDWLRERLADAGARQADA